MDGRAEDRSFRLFEAASVMITDWLLRGRFSVWLACLCITRLAVVKSRHL